MWVVGFVGFLGLGNGFDSLVVGAFGWWFWFCLVVFWRLVRGCD